MVQLVEAVYDGAVLKPEADLKLPANTRVRLTVEVMEPKRGAERSFLAVAQSLNLEGPPDWASRVDDYLYGADDSHAP